jgi:N-acetylglucosaminyldiphosphoundecaprenol N-acetyl-beta-D-mannosaminyltransferase
MYLQEGELQWQPQGGAAPVLSAPGQTPELPFRNNRGLPRVVIDGVSMHAIDEQTCIEHILGELSHGRGGVVVTPNVDHLRRCQQDISFSALVAEAELVVPDGMPIVWASRLQGTPLPQRVAGSDLISSLSGAAAGAGKSVFLLGGDSGTAEAAADVLRDRYPQLKIAGTFCPPVGFEKDETQIKLIISALKDANPDIIYVALGSPKQERLIDRIRRNFPRSWWLGVGVSFSFLCGDVRRAPLWMRKNGLEWVHRLGQEPKRLFKRYVLVGIPFASTLLMRSAARGLPNRLLGRRHLRDLELDSPEKRMFAPEQSSSFDRSTSRGAEAAQSESSIVMEDTPAPLEAPRGAGSTASRLRGLILLGGAVRPSLLAQSIGRSVLDLPTGNGGTVLTRWLDDTDELSAALGIGQLPVRLLVDANAIEPRSASPSRYSLERDSSEYRGTGGLLASIAQDYADDDLILVGNAAQVLLDPLVALHASLRKTGGAVSVVGHRDGTPSGLMLVTCRTLRILPKTGFLDMKEQALPLIGAHFDVRVLQCRRPTGWPVRSLTDYIAALHALYQPPGRPVVSDPLAEDWKSTFAIIEPGASVSPTARVHDSVVLAGGAVEAGTVIVRSVVAGVVRKDRRAVDECIEPVRRSAAGGVRR